MEAFLFIVVLLLFAVTAACVFRYLQASFALLALVQQDEALWKSLGEPRKTWVRETSPGGFHTIQPIGPWLAWVWAAQPPAKSSAQVRMGLQRTSRLLRTGLALFALTVLAMLLLVLSAN